MQSFEKKHLFIFLFLAVILGLTLSSVFYLLASYSQLLLNILALGVLAFLVIRSFWGRRKLVTGGFSRRFVFMIPGYFHLANAIVLLLVFIPNTIRTGQPVFIGALLVSFFLAGLYFVKMILKKRVNNEK